MLEQVIRQIRSELETSVGRSIMFWLVWKHVSVRLRKVVLWDKSWAQKAGWLQMGAEWSEDAGVGSLGR